MVLPAGTARRLRRRVEGRTRDNQLRLVPVGVIKFLVQLFECNACFVEFWLVCGICAERIEQDVRYSDTPLVTSFDRQRNIRFSFGARPGKVGLETGFIQFE